MRRRAAFPGFRPFPHSFLCGSCLWCWWWSGSPLVPSEHLWSRESLPRSSQCPPIHHLGICLSLGARELRRNVPWKEAQHPFPHLRPVGFDLLTQQALPLSLVTIFMSSTPGSTEQLDGARPGRAPFSFPFLGILGTKRGFLRRGGWPAHIHTNPQISRNRLMRKGTTDFPSLGKRPEIDQKRRPQKRS